MRKRTWNTCKPRMAMLNGLGIRGPAATLCSRVDPHHPKPKGRIEIRGADDGTAEILIYEEIGFDWWTGDGMTAKRFHEELQALGDVQQINVRIDSPGGDVFDALAIYNQITRHNATVAVDIDGMAASAASVIAMAGDSVNMGQGSMLMIHDAMWVAIGNAQEMRDVAEILDKVDGEIATIYAAKAGGSAKHFRDLMDVETWLNAEEAVSEGLADTTTAGAPTNRAPRMTADLARARRERRGRAAMLDVA